MLFRASDAIHCQPMSDVIHSGWAHQLACSKFATRELQVHRLLRPQGSFTTTVTVTGVDLQSGEKASVSDVPLN